MSKLTDVLAEVAKNKHVVECQVGGRTIRFETGEVAKQAGGAVLVTSGETTVLVTACATPQPREGVDFFPLTVDYEERMYAAGKIPGGWIKRESRPPERAILVSRVIDRPCRPLFPEGFRNDVHIVGLCMSADSENNPDVLALCGAGAALSISDIPFEGPVAGVRIGYIDDQFVINPTESELKNSTLNLTVAGTKDNLNMVECGCQEVPESMLIDAFKVAHEAIRTIIKAVEELVAVCGKPKGNYPIYSPDAELEKLVRAYQYEPIAKAMRVIEKHAREVAFDAIDLEALKASIEADGNITEEEKASRLAICNDPSASKDYAAISKHIKEDELMTMIVDEGIRPDGRKINEIRPLWGRVGVMARTHGSAIFTRGQTQVLSACTLGTLSEGQSFDNVFGETNRRYMHHYNFPPFSVGEAKAMRSPGRREIGHGALAERALMPVLPSEEEFPYAIRVVSDVLESNGSSSMASTCGSTLSLLDAGVPIKSPVAGIAMGLIKKGDNYVVLTDIQGMEDAFGEMDFKVTGTAEGVTALQMDIKMKGVTMEILAKALQQAKEARLEILDMIHELIPTHRAELSKYAPRVTTIQIPVDRIKDVIGPGGKVINKIISDTGAKVEIEQDGRVFVAGVNCASVENACKMINDLIRNVEVGEIYDGKVVRMMDFGAFIEILPGREGLLHVSKIKPYHVRSVEDVVKVGDEIKVKVEEIDNLGRINLTRKDLWSEEELAEGGSQAEVEQPRSERRRMRVERPERNERPEHVERPERSERAERSERKRVSRREPERADRAAMRAIHEERSIAPRYQEDLYDDRPLPVRRREAASMREAAYEDRPVAPRRREQAMYEDRPVAPRRREQPMYEDRPVAPRRREQPMYEDRPMAPRRREQPVYEEHLDSDLDIIEDAPVRRRRRRRSEM
ncbi:polyribonucleotide nucleotidyltransferase [bacterium]|nr:polyribonucleotide nucleotidyltransferase [bacterium]